jgi:hypothetical protein
MRISRVRFIAIAGLSIVIVAGAGLLSLSRAGSDPEDRLDPYPIDPAVETVSPDLLETPVQPSSISIEGTLVTLPPGMIVWRECPSERNRCTTRVLYATSPDEATASTIYLDDAGKIIRINIQPSDATVFQPLLDAAKELPTPTASPLIPANIAAAALNTAFEYRTVQIPEITGSMEDVLLVIYRQGDQRSRVWISQDGSVVYTDIEPDHAEIFAPLISAGR